MSGRMGRIGAWMALALALAAGFALFGENTSGQSKVESAEAATGPVIVRVIGPALL
ncbi:hypothetical protein [Novosphingobium sp.]|jgi:hypothetical protein|uniref:hypothetical protein n=1 Tax=Novosphingobium sp. TaxID=1874826 RepID=UPI002FE0553C